MKLETDTMAHVQLVLTANKSLLNQSHVLKVLTLIKSVLPVMTSVCLAHQESSVLVLVTLLLQMIAQPVRFAQMVSTRLLLKLDMHQLDHHMRRFAHQVSISKIPLKDSVTHAHLVATVLIIVSMLVLREDTALEMSKNLLYTLH